MKSRAGRWGSLTSPSPRLRGSSSAAAKRLTPGLIGSESSSFFFYNRLLAGRGEQLPSPIITKTRTAARNPTPHGGVAARGLAAERLPSTSVPGRRGGRWARAADLSALQPRGWKCWGEGRFGVSGGGFGVSPDSLSPLQEGVEGCPHTHTPRGCMGRMRDL